MNSSIEEQTNSIIYIANKIIGRFGNSSEKLEIQKLSLLTLKILKKNISTYLCMI